MVNKKIIDERRKVIEDNEINTEPLDVEKFKKDVPSFIEELLNVQLTDNQKREIKMLLQFKEKDIYG